MTAESVCGYYGAREERSQTLTMNPIIALDNNRDHQVNASYLYPRSSFVLARFLNVGHLRSPLDSHESPRVGVPVSILGHLTQVRPSQAGTSRQHLAVSSTPHSPTTAQPGLSSTSLAQSEYLLSKQMFPGYSVCSFGLVRASIQVIPSFPAQLVNSHKNEPDSPIAVDNVGSTSSQKRLKRPRPSQRNTVPEIVTTPTAPMKKLRLSPEKGSERSALPSKPGGDYFASVVTDSEEEEGEVISSCPGKP